MMIDTVKVVIDVDWPQPLFGGQILSTKIDSDGVEVREYQLLKHLGFEGSWSSNLQLRCVDGRNLEVYGSPTKWLVGHNLFGSTDLFGLLRECLDRLAAGPLAGYPPVSDFALSDARIQRIDLNEMFELKSLEDVKLYLGWAAARTSLSHRGKGALAENGCTLSWGMHRGNRSAWKVKFYAKGPESRVVRKGKSSLPGRLLASDEVMGWVDRQLRLEYELHSRELAKLGLNKVSDWSPKTACEVWQAKADLFFWGDEPVMVEENLDIPRRVRNAYLAWKAGEDMRADCSRPTFYRMRADVKRFYGCDIALPAPVEQSNLVVMPIRRVLELRRAEPVKVQSLIKHLLAA